MDNASNSEENNFNLKELFNEEDLIVYIETIKAENADLYYMLDILKKTTDFLLFYRIIEVDKKVLRHVVPYIKKTVISLCENSSICTKTEDGNESIEILQSNIEVIISFMKIFLDIIDYFIKLNKQVEFAHIPSVPLDLAFIIHATFKHCRNSQHMYDKNPDLNKKLLEMFRTIQDVNNKFLNALQNFIAFNTDSEEEMTVLKNILDFICNSSGVLTGMNTKAMSDNWKCYLLLIKKYLVQAKFFNFLLPIRILTKKIHLNLWSTIDAKDIAVESTIKITGFLLKIALKLFEFCFDFLDNNYMEIIKFSATIYNFPAGCYYYQSNINTAVTTNLFVPLDTFLMQLVNEEKLFHVPFFVHNNTDRVFTDEHHFGVVVCCNLLLKNLPKLLKNNPNNSIKNNFRTDEVLSLLFNSLKHCYSEFFGTSNFYEDLVTNVAVSILLPPNIYEAHVELLLIKNVLQNDIWCAMLAIDVWCLVLKNCPVSLITVTLHSLIETYLSFNVQYFVQLPAIVYLKCLMQRIFNLLTVKEKSNWLKEYKPMENDPIWRILGFENIPSDARFYAEALLNNFYGKFHLIVNRTCHLNDVIFLVECFEIFSTINFHELQLNCSKLVQIVGSLWAFRINDSLINNNNFYKYFISKLSVITSSLLIQEFNGENLLLILNQFRVLNDNHESIIISLLLIKIFHSLSRRSISHLSNNDSIITLITIHFQILLANNETTTNNNNNPILFEMALQVFIQLASSKHYSEVARNVLNNSSKLKYILQSYKQRNVGDESLKLDLSHFNKLHFFKFQHHCLEWSDNNAPRPKKMKTDDKVDEIIDGLKVNVQRLSELLKNTRLNSKQARNIHGLINDMRLL